MLALLWGGSLMVLPRLPARVPLHWNIHNQVDGWGGPWLATLLLGAVDGQPPVKEFVERPDLQARVRQLALEILKRPNMSLDEAMDEASMRFDEPA